MKIITKFAPMRLFNRFFILLISSSMLLTSCMALDGTAAYRKKNKCCGIIKCDMHRRAQQQKRKQAVNGGRKIEKKEQRIKRGY